MVVPFRWGRVDVAECPFDEDRHADAEGNLDTTLEWAVGQLGLTHEEVVALMGAHTLGRAEPENSGYDGEWVNQVRAYATCPELSV
jgi:catalase (peroxidase I)